MTDTLTLFPLVPVPGELSIDERFTLFHQHNPAVYDALVALTRQLVARGRRRKVGMGMLFEQLRWQWAMTTDDPTSDYRLNNDFRSRYARLIMKQEPDLAGVYETRELRS